MRARTGTEDLIRNNQNGRRRGRGGARPQGGGPSGNYGNSGGGSRIDNRQRGNATQLLEKYKAMARDATQNGDRVQAEFYMQYADHYFRVLSEFRARDPQPAPRSTYDDDEDGYGASGVGQNYAPAGERDDDDDGDDGAERPAYRQNGARGNDGYPQGERPRSDGYTQNGPRQRDDRPRDDANRVRDDGNRARDDRPRDEGNRQREERAPRDDRGREQRSQDYRATGDDRPREERSVRDDGERQRAAAPREGSGDGGESRAPREENRLRSGRQAGDDRADSRRYNGERDWARREAAPRAAGDAADLIGIPGPATMAPIPAASFDEPAVGADEAVAPAAVASEAPPVKRPRGRPRKVVVADNVDG